MEVIRRLGGFLKRATQRFNAESRAHRVLDKQKAGEVRPAPKYESSVRDLERTLTANPELVEKLSRKDAPLDDRLKKVYVTSKRDVVDADESTERPLPLNRKTPEDFEFGYRENAKVPKGKMSMRNVLEMLNAHQLEEEGATPAKFSAQYKVKESYIEDILKNYRVLSLHVNDRKAMRRLAAQDIPLVEGIKIQKKNKEKPNKKEIAEN